ncbi:OTU domain-containing protein 6B [Terramyces sp. JEL0728]|nr:OTU domain-containing protein 6B [Terramyces sp. JEL0728]
MEEILARHKKELKLLQGEVMQLKKSVGKGSASKSKKKEVEEHIAKIELELKERHAAELNLAQESTTNIDSNAEILNQEKRENEFEAMRAEAAKEAEQMPDNKQLETLSIDSYLQPLGLKIKQAYGHCLFYAIADQLYLRDPENTLNFQDLRKLATDYMLDHKDDFMPFLTNKHGDILNDSEFEDYCEEMCTGAVWGGQSELQALCQSLKVQINIVQMNSVLVKLGEEFDRLPPLLLSYHRHSFGLGEHYK